MSLKRDAEAAVQEVLDAVSPDGPGCVVGVVAANETLAVGSKGLANLEHRVALTPKSRFYLASVSKQVTALATLLAAERGLLDLNGSIRSVIPDLPAYLDAVTIRRLLEHTGGVRDYLSIGFLAGMSPDYPFGEGDLLEILGRQQALNFAPGTDVSYSNSGFVLAAMAVARGAGQPLDAFARETIFAPLGMHASRFQHDHALLVPDKAYGYQRRGDDWLVANSMLDTVGDGGMYASLEDMLAWAKNLLAPRVGAAALAVMQTPVKTASGVLTGYGMGLALGQHRGLPIIEHGGGLGGYRTHIAAYPTEGFAVVSLCNDAAGQPNRHASAIATRCLQTRLAPAPKAVDVPPETLKQHEGVYRNPGDVVLSLVEQDGKLYVRGLPSPLAPLSPDTFAFEDDPLGSIVAFGGSGFSITRPGGRIDPFTRCTPQGDFDADALLGDFESSEIGTVLRVSRDDAGRPVASLSDGAAVRLRSLGPDCIWAADMGAVLVLARQDGAVRGFRLNTQRVREVAFERLS